MSLADRLADVRRCAAGATIIAVSKTQPVSLIAEAYAAGQRDFGENYVQELEEKARWAETAGLVDIRWHFIGKLQSNKIRQLLPWVTVVHSLESVGTAEKLERSLERRLDVFLQVNIDGEDSKGGIPPENVGPIAQEISKLPHLFLRGLMCIPNPNLVDPAPSFEAMRNLEISCRPFTHGDLSMGMSDDFEVALRSGATHVRVGTKIFGKRS